MEPRLPLSEIASLREPSSRSFGSGQACHDDPLWLYWVWPVDLGEWDLGHRFNGPPELLSNWIFRKHPHFRHEIPNSTQWAQEQLLPHLITVKPWRISEPPDSFTWSEENTFQFAMFIICVWDEMHNLRHFASVLTQTFVCWPSNVDGHCDVHHSACLFLYNLRHCLVHGALNNCGIWTMNPSSSYFNFDLCIRFHMSASLTILNDSCKINICASLGGLSSTLSNTTATYHTNFKCVSQKLCPLRLTRSAFIDIECS